MLVISRSSFEENGCVNCGCDYCAIGHVSGKGVICATCASCKCEFIILTDGLSFSKVGFDTGNKYSDGSTIFEYPKLSDHPRKGISKNAFVNPDIRPENGIGDYCSPRDIGYDLACFVKSKEAGIRITNMINNINAEYDNKAFSCTLDYRVNEPLWIQVKIDYPSESSAEILSQLIIQNDYIITENILRKAIDLELNFKKYWKFQVKNKTFDVIKFDFINCIVDDPRNLTKKNLDDAFNLSSSLNNYLDQFEIFAIYHHIDQCINNGNVDKAYLLAVHLINIYSSLYNSEFFINLKKKDSFIFNLRDVFHKSLISLVNADYVFYYSSDDSILETESKKNNDVSMYPKINLDNENSFLFDWQLLISKIFSVIDIDKLKSITDFCNQKISSMSSLKNLNDDLESYVMFSLFGLYIQVSKQIELNNLDNAVLAILHVANQKNSDLINSVLINSENGDKISDVYQSLLEISDKYCVSKKNTDQKIKKLIK